MVTIVLSFFKTFIRGILAFCWHCGTLQLYVGVLSSWGFWACLSMYYSRGYWPFWVHSTTEPSGVSVAGFPILTTISSLLYMTQACIKSCTFYSLPHVLHYTTGRCLEFQFDWILYYYSLIVFDYYCTFPLKFSFQVDW